MFYRVDVNARERGAIGQFYRIVLEVSVDDNQPTRDTIVDAVLKQHGDRWELNNVLAFTPKASS